MRPDFDDTILRAAASRSQKSFVQFCDDWRAINAANPGVVGPSRPLTINAFSGVNGSYDDNTNGVKAIFHFKRPWLFPPKASAECLFRFSYSNSASIYLSQISAVADSFTFAGYTRVRWILREFDPAEVTWGNHTLNEIDTQENENAVFVSTLFDSRVKQPQAGTAGVYCSIASDENNRIYGAILDTKGSSNSGSNTFFSATSAVTSNVVAGHLPFALVYDRSKDVPKFTA